MWADLETGYLGRIGNKRWQRASWLGVRRCLLGWRELQNRSYSRSEWGKCRWFQMRVRSNSS